MTEYIAIASKTKPDDISILAKILREKKGVVYFEVINGAWEGCITSDGTLYLGNSPKGKDSFPDQKIVWIRRHIPQAYGRDYNEVMASIRQELRGEIVPLKLSFEEMIDTMLKKKPDIDKVRFVEDNLLEIMCKKFDKRYVMAIYNLGKYHGSPSILLEGEGEDEIPF